VHHQGIGIPAVDLFLTTSDRHNRYEFASPAWHKGFDDPVNINTIARQSFDNLSKHQDLNKMISIQPDISKWYFDPVVGFGIKAPPDYFRQASDINVAPSLEQMQRFRAPDNYYLSPAAQLPTRVDMPRHDWRIPNQGVPTRSEYRQIFNVNPGVTGSAHTTPVATPNYNQNFVTPPQSFTPPQRYDVK
jgi:hypothetical protein